MSDHTKEPWGVGMRGMEAGKIISISDGIKVVAETNYNFPECAKEDARRIVACVNACVGIKTEFLEHLLREKSTIDSEVQIRAHAIRTLQAQAHDAAIYNDAITAQRDKLLIALKDAHPYITNDYQRCTIGNLIAECEGGRR